MKLKLSSKRAFFAAKSDEAKQQRIDSKLKAVSATQRHAEIHTPALKRTPEPFAPPAALSQKPQLKVKITKKGPQNLSLNSKGALALPQGEELRWKARSMVGRHLPTMQCNSCQISRVCPKFKAGYECAFTPFLNSHRVENADDLIKYMKAMCGQSMSRAQKMAIFEAASGGAPTLETSEALDLAFKQLKELHGVMTEQGEQTVELEGDATLIGSIFSGMKMEQLVQETENMKSNDPVPLLSPGEPAIGLAANDPRAKQPADVVDELVRDAILGQTEALEAKSKKSLPKASVTEIHESTLS